MRTLVQNFYDRTFHARSPQQEWQWWHAGTEEKLRAIQAGALPKEITDPVLLKYYSWLCKEILELIQPHREKIQNILEIGAGSGTLSFNLAEAFGVPVTLLDNSHLALEYAARVASHFNQTPALVQSRADTMPIDTDTFDFAHSVGLIEHFKEEDILKILLETRRVLKKCGLFYLGVPNFLSPELIKIWKRRGKGSEQWMRPQDLRSFLTTTGFHVKKTGYCGYTFDTSSNFCLPGWLERLLGHRGLGFLVYGLAQK